ncbi:alpha-ketoglutarate-dependent dioxygenase alkB homolog 4 [Cimex lectularius]|uniref:Uncharacterized protein n=1 Tax=Cimex lectularius TaxID=79782 RepID=A0A8I6TCV0_CIMLE|nr:alpha-ketoglutarate-dependent dioxygenase alkB homolog 4 [Cimex lectularius]
METDRSKICGCKGIRTCLKCECLFDISSKAICSPDKENSNPYFYCHECRMCWPGWEGQDHSDHRGEPITLNGIFLLADFLSPEEEEELLKNMDSLPWEVSQSGRRKQNFGPKCNFKKRKLRIGNFCGFPKVTEFVQEKFKSVGILKDFKTVEQCSLEYDPLRGASIDPHIDDCWIWGERVVTVNLLSDTVLTLIKYRGDPNRYNLPYAPPFSKTDLSMDNVLIRIPMIRRSLFVMTGEARYDWEHQIYREDVATRRVCLAYREFTLPYLKGGQHENEGSPILKAALEFWT